MPFAAPLAPERSQWLVLLGIAVAAAFALPAAAQDVPIPRPSPAKVAPDSTDNAPAAVEPDKLRLLLHTEDRKDPFVPLLLWWAVESKALSDPDRVIQLMTAPETWQAPLAQKPLLSVPYSIGPWQSAHALLAVMRWSEIKLVSRWEAGFSKACPAMLQARAASGAWSAWTVTGAE